MHQPRSAIKLRQLEYFLAVAKTRHFSNAAASLFVTQPTLSHQIAELEGQIGTPLFNRSGKSVRLTEAGETFRAYATRALAELDAGRGALEEMAGLQRGTLKVGVSQSFVGKLLPPILGEFTARYPAIDLTIVEMTAGEIEHGLVQSDLDIGIAFAPAVLDETELEPLVEERLVLIARAGHRLSEGRGSIAMRELNAQAMALLSRDYSTRNMIDQYLRTAQAVPTVMCETNSIAVMIGIAKHSDIVAIVPEGAVEPSDDIVVLQLTDPSPVRVSALLWSRQSFRTHAARAFAALARQRFDTHLALPSSQ